MWNPTRRIRKVWLDSITQLTDAQARGRLPDGLDLQWQLGYIFLLAGAANLAIENGLAHVRFLVVEHDPISGTTSTVVRSAEHPL